MIAGAVHACRLMTSSVRSHGNAILSTLALRIVTRNAAALK